MLPIYSSIASIFSMISRKLERSRSENMKAIPIDFGLNSALAGRFTYKVNRNTQHLIQFFQNNGIFEQSDTGFFSKGYSQIDIGCWPGFPSCC